jgi:hypothetical protein
LGLFIPVYLVLSFAEATPGIPNPLQSGAVIVGGALLALKLAGAPMSVAQRVAIGRYAALGVFGFLAFGIISPIFANLQEGAGVSSLLFWIIGTVMALAGVGFATFWTRLGEHLWLSLSANAS